jgi:ribonuclease HI
MAVIYVDGSGWNGRRCGWCVLREGQDPIITESAIKHSNNEAEYIAVIEALQMKKAKGSTIYSDSQLVVNQVNGEWACKTPLLKPLRDQAQELLKKKKATLVWVPREENKAGKVLERKW